MKYKNYPLFIFAGAGILFLVLFLAQVRYVEPQLKGAGSLKVMMMSDSTTTGGALYVTNINKNDGITKIPLVTKANSASAIVKLLAGRYSVALASSTGSLPETYLDLDCVSIVGDEDDGIYAPVDPSSFTINENEVLTCSVFVMIPRAKDTYCEKVVGGTCKVGESGKKACLSDNEETNFGQGDDCPRISKNLKSICCIGIDKRCEDISKATCESRSSCSGISNTELRGCLSSQVCCLR